MKYTMLGIIAFSIIATSGSKHVIIRQPELETGVKPKVEQGNGNEVLALTGEFTAYSLGDGYTPSDTMASGKKVYKGAIACPIKYKLGTKIEIKDLGVYTCEDRMAKRYREGNYFDIYMDSKVEAIQWGRKQLTFKELN